jgi:DNA-binding NarL/FixJ family response regulator
LIADYAPTRVAVRLALEDECEVCAEAENATTAAIAAQRTQPDVCLIGLELPGGAIEAIRAVREAAPDTRMIVLTARHDVDELLSVIRAGAIGYLSPGSDPAVLRRVVPKVAAGEAVVPRALVRDLIHELQGVAPGATGLTAREAQVLGMLRRGQSTAAIAERLGISPVTVRRHISALIHKAGADDRSALSLHGAGRRASSPGAPRR